MYVVRLNVCSALSGNVIVGKKLIVYFVEKRPIALVVESGGFNTGSMYSTTVDGLFIVTAPGVPGNSFKLRMLELRLDSAFLARILSSMMMMLVLTSTRFPLDSSRL